MGLINRQIDAVRQMISNRWSALYVAEKKIETANLQAIARVWDVDPRVIAFANMWVSGTGIDWEQPVPVSSVYRTAWPEYTHDQRTVTFKGVLDGWTKYHIGEIGGNLYDALKDAGYRGPESDKEPNYYSNTQSGMLEVALRTTRKKWDTISGLLESLSISLALAGSRADVLKAVSELMDGLK
jgi:hypothetical protein